METHTHDPTGFIGRDNNICATEAFGMPCCYGEYDSNRAVYRCSNKSENAACENRIRDVDSGDSESLIPPQ